MRSVPLKRVLLAVCAVVVACAPPPGDDYLDADLRLRVEALKVEVEAAPATRENAVQRARVFWEWLNAYALTGRTLPMDSTTTVMRVMSRNELSRGISPAILRTLDDKIHELAIRDARPDAIGDVTAKADELLVAGSWAQLEQTYTVGSMGMATGGSFLLGAQIMADQASMQHEDPAADNYVSVRSSNADARWEKPRIPLSGKHGGFKDEAEMVVFRLAEATLEHGDTVTFTYGDRSQGSSGLRLQTLTTEKLVLPIYVDLTGAGVFFTPRWPHHEIVGRNEVESLAVFAPSVVAASEEIDLVVRSEDRHFNRSRGVTVQEYEVLLDGEAVATVPAGSESAAGVEGLSVSSPRVVRFVVRSADGRLEARSNPVWVESAPEQRIYWGELHGHAGFAEGQGGGEQFYRYARDDARLDFVALTDHDSSMDDFEWRYLQELSRDFNREGEFLAILGYEWSATRDLGGHHNVFFRSRDRSRVPNQEAPTLAQMYERLRTENQPSEVLVIPHAHQAGDWNQSPADLQPLVEIMSQHGTFEWFGNRYLQNGFEIGFIAASDDHRAKPGYNPGLFFSPHVQGPGLAAAVAPSKTTDAVFDALRSRRAYATSGQRILLSATLNGEPMGTRQPYTERREFSCRVSGTSPIDRIDLIKNGRVLRSRSYLSAPLESSAWVQIGFESSSEVFAPDRDNPRVYRVWSGVLEVAGARLLGVESPGLKNPYLEWAEIDPEQPQRVRFYTETRGRMNTLLLRLSGASSSTRVTLHLDAARENGFAPPLVRAPVDIPAAEVAFQLDDLEDSRIEHVLPVGRHLDRLSLQVIDADAALDREFDFVDLGSTAPGDYYYFRVTQLDGGQAWSSPFWVGRRDSGDGAAAGG